ncbi:reverse transcriptase domain-containing protein [Tanacetum coccineum]
MRNNDLRTELEYFSEDYDDEREMDPRPEPTRAATPPLRVASPRIPIRMQKWLMPVSCHMFTYTLKDSARIWWNSQKAGSILNYEYLKAKFRSHFSQQKKFTKTHLAVHNIKQREGKSTRAFITRYTDDTLQILGLHEEQRILGFVHGLRTRSLVEHLSTDLPSTYKGLMEKTYTWVEAREVATNGASSDRRDSFESPKEILATEKAARSFEPPSKMFGSKRSRDMSKYCHFHEDYGHDTNDCRHLRTQIQEAINSGKLSHLVKGIKKERTKSSDTPRGESKKNKDTTPAEATILMVNNAPVIIEAKIFERKVGRVYMDNGSSCEIIYEHCFEKLNPTIKATKVDRKTPLVGFSRERSWSISEVSLEITIGDAPLSGTETLNFVIVRSDSSYNMLLGRAAMQRMGIVVSTIHEAIKFHTKKGIRTVLSADKTDEGKKRAKKILATNEERVLSCVNAEEKMIVNDKYLDQMVTIRKQLPEHLKKELQNLLKSNADVFEWTHVDMTGILRTIMVKGKPFNTEHKLNEYNHVKPIKQNKRVLGPDHNMAACKEIEELMKKGILRKVKHQTWVANLVMVKKSDGGWRMENVCGFHKLKQGLS